MWVVIPLAEYTYIDFFHVLVQFFSFVPPERVIWCIG